MKTNLKPALAATLAGIIDIGEPPYDGLRLFQLLCHRHGQRQQPNLSPKRKLALLRQTCVRVAGGSDSSVFVDMLVDAIRSEYAKRRSALARRKEREREVGALVFEYRLPEAEHLNVIAGLPAEKFYKTPEWRALRYDILAVRGARCELCGASAARGATVHVDHIEARHLHREKAFDPQNLQVLCEDCHAGRRHYEAPDWRQPR